MGEGTAYTQAKAKRVWSRFKGPCTVYKAVKEAFEKDAEAGELILKNNFYLEPGPFDIVSVMDKSVNAQPFEVKGPVIDLFDPTLPVL